MSKVSINSPRSDVGKVDEITNRGYKGGEKSPVDQEGAKKIPAPKGV